MQCPRCDKEIDSLSRNCIHCNYLFDAAFYERLSVFFRLNFAKESLLSGLKRLEAEIDEYKKILNSELRSAAEPHDAKDTVLETRIRPEKHTDSEVSSEDIPEEISENLPSEVADTPPPPHTIESDSPAAEVFSSMPGDTQATPEVHANNEKVEDVIDTQQPHAPQYESTTPASVTQSQTTNFELLATGSRILM